MGGFDGLAHMLGNHGFDATLVDRDRLVRGHLRPFIRAFDLTRLEEVEDTPAVIRGRMPNRQVANWAGHSVGDTRPSLKACASVFSGSGVSWTVYGSSSVHQPS